MWIQPGNDAQPLRSGLSACASSVAHGQQDAPARRRSAGSPRPWSAPRGRPPRSWPVRFRRLRSGAARRRPQSSSSSALAPLSARRRPPGRVRGRHQPASRSSGATARAVTTSARTPAAAAVSARSRRTVTFFSSRSARISSSQVVRRSSGSSRVTSRSGRARASGMPGSPAPEPTSISVASGGTSSATTAQLRTCRSHRRGTSRGPIRPRSTPDVARQLQRTGGPTKHGRRRSRRPCPFHVEPRGRSCPCLPAARSGRCGLDHDAAVGLLAVRLARRGRPRPPRRARPSARRPTSGPAAVRSPVRPTSWQARAAMSSRARRRPAR